MKIDLHQLLRSIVTVRAQIPDDAFTARTLGILREGSGVVIRENGVVLTIGYLITEAEEVWLTTHEGRVIAGHALAYDQETGFGLVQSLGPLGLPALDFGSAARAKLGDPVVLADGAGEFVEANIMAMQEFAGYWEYMLEAAIFTAPAHPSWGGAALIDSQGKLLGIGSLRLEITGSAKAVMPTWSCRSTCCLPFWMIYWPGGTPKNCPDPGLAFSRPRATARLSS